MSEAEIELNDEQIDQLVDRVDSPKEAAPEREMTAQPTPKETIEEYKFTHNGKEINATKEQLIKWASQGYDYPQRMQKLNQERLQWDSQKQEWEKKIAPYRTIDDWAAKNPDKWTQLQQSWQSASNGQVPQNNQGIPQAIDPAYLQKIQNLEQRFQQFEPAVNGLLENLSTQKAAQEDEALDQEIKSIQEKYKDLDFNSIDDNGKSLEYRVLEHASKIGVKNFTTAFRDLLHDELISRAQAQAKQNVSKNIQVNTKLGIIGKSPTPTKGINQVKDVRNKSYNDIEAEIHEELRSGAYT